MNVLRGISPRLFSICFNNDMGKVIPSFSVRHYDIHIQEIGIRLIDAISENSQKITFTTGFTYYIKL
jgi:hypothetical protein